MSNYDNWTAGGVNSSSFGILSEMGLSYKANKHNWENSLKLEYGLSKVGLMS